MRTKRKMFNTIAFTKKTMACVFNGTSIIACLNSRDDGKCIDYKRMYNVSILQSTSKHVQTHTQLSRQLYMHHTTSETT